MNLRLSGVKVFLPEQASPLFHIPKLEIKAGTKLLIQGPSGAGKSTLLHLLAGLFHPSEGKVFVNDTDLTHLNDAARGRLRRESFGIVFQQLNLLAHLTALENVLLGGPSEKPSVERASAALDRLGCRHLAGTRTDRLSLGEQQRIAVARSVYAVPKIVLADEPTSSLDGANAEAVIRELLRLPGDPTVVVVSHDDRLVPHFSERLIFGQWGEA